jgi:RNA polymerase sigma-B factor
MAAVSAATERLTEELSHPPTPEEIAAHLEIEVSEAVAALAADRIRRPLGLDSPVRGGDGDDDSAPEWLGTVDDGYELIEDRLALESALPSLDERQREMLRLRFVEDLPQSRIAERIGCSQMHVSRTLRSTLARLRAQIEAGIVEEEIQGRKGCRPAGTV